MDEKKLCKRTEQNPKDCWAIEDLFESDEQWKNEFDALKEEIKQVEKYKGRLAEDAFELLNYLKLEDALSVRLEKIYVFANQKYHEDTANGNYQGLSSMAQGLMTEFEGLTSFAEPEILEIEEKRLKAFLHENKELALYQIYLDEITRKRDHILSLESEKILADAGEMANGPDDIFSMFNHADLKFPDVVTGDGRKLPLTHGKYISYMESSDRELRKSAFMNLYHTYKKYENTLASIYRANLKQEYFFAKTRKYDSSLAMALDGSQIPLSVFDNLIETVHQYMPLMHQYVKLRKDRLKLSEIHMYDLYTPMVEDVKMEIPFETAKEMVMKGLAPLGEEYLSHIQDGFSNRWIDVYENEGKKSGAYSWGAYGTHPYVLLNYQNSLNHVFTLAHEMGHALHSWYSDANQPYRYAGYRIFVAEVASTCNEALLMDNLLKQTKKKEERAYLLNYFMEQFRTTLYRQTMFAEFEKITHQMNQEGKTLTAEELCRIYHDLNVLYYGEDMVVDEEIDMEWARIPHFYNPFYVYQYATGYSAAIAISQKIINGEKHAVENYKSFLKGGSSLSPIALLKLAGVDMTTKEPIEKALKRFETLLVEFAGI